MFFGLGVREYLNLFNCAKRLAHVFKKRTVDVVVEVGKGDILG